MNFISVDEEEEDEEEEGLSQIRFPCVYCGKQMTSVELVSILLTTL